MLLLLHAELPAALPDRLGRILAALADQPVDTVADALIDSVRGSIIGNVTTSPFL